MTPETDHTGPGSLSHLMDFDHVIQVHDDGAVTEPRNVYGPERLEHSEGENGRPDPDGLLDDWQLISGFSGQYRYAGPIMHNSERIAGPIARHIIENPGLYVALVCYWPDDPDNDPADGDYIEGWAIAHRITD